MNQNNMDVLIVGAGPTGLTLACSLASQGITCKIIDKRSTESVIPRAVNISGPTLEIFNKLGIDGNYLKEGVKLDNLSAYWNKKRLLNINYKYVQLSHPYFFHLEQSRVEFYLNNLLESLGIKVERELELTNLFQKESHVTASIRDKNGDFETLNFHYVVGCDGGNSTVRELMNISCDRQSLSGYFVLMDVVMDHDLPKNQLYYYLSEEGYLIMVPLPHNKYRIIASIKDNYPGKEHVDLSKASFQKIIDERGPGNIRIKENLWATSAEFYYMLANNAQINRVFLAGDALHLFSPIGGTNMNIGIQDAYSLGKKLIPVLNGSNDRVSLNCYETERLKIAKKVVNYTSLATKLLTRNGDTQEEDKKYLPIHKNRKFIKTLLPRQFSGIDFT